MTLGLHTLHPAKGARKERKRVGRGLGSKGSYSGRGVKGQRARTGGRAGLKLKGIRSLMLKIPKQRGFNSLAPKAAPVNVGMLGRTFPKGGLVTPATLKKNGLIPADSVRIKILGDGILDVVLRVEGCLLSASARTKIEKAGGSIKDVLPLKP
ncbi:MAG TPA: 50S ribosomal protein L15 [Patescibacteria group bacterium]|nr:50S ribosomal protein L15 [Patescibacteria group bacterium]